MSEPFHYLRVEDRVPRDVVHLVIGGAITVVEAKTFQDYENLWKVELREGVEKIGREAFTYCVNLTRVDCPSSLRTIDDVAFEGCYSLREVVLREGLRRIGVWAFWDCGVRRIAVPSSVAEIGARAFEGCQWLSRVNLVEGLLPTTFGSGFNDRIAFSDVDIEEYAVANRNTPEAATLAGGAVMVARGAFEYQRRIGISSMAIVVQTGAEGNVCTTVVNGGIEWDPERESPQLIILASPHLALMRPGDLKDFTDWVDLIAYTVPEAEGSDLEDEDFDEDEADQILGERVCGRIRDGFVDHLSMLLNY